MTAPEWRDCADPDELAAAVAAGVVPLVRVDSGAVKPTKLRQASEFTMGIGWGDRYQLPTSWSPEPPAPDDLAARARRHADGHPESRDLIEGLLGAWDQLADRAAEAQAAAWDQRLNWTGKWPTPPDGCEAVFLPTDVVDHYVSAEPPSGRWDRQASSVADACREAQARRGTTPTTPGGDPRDAVRLLDLAWGVIANADGWGDDTSWRQAAERWRDGYHRFLDALREEPTAPPAPTPPPAPPWPGAVLSGLTDEDGVPTWLAQAGQVRGEQVRACTSVPWLPNTSYGEDEWVEVRAPRAVPEPETERVPWWESVGRVVRDATGREAQILRADVGDGAGPSVYAYHDQEPGAALRRLYAPVNGFGTVEVLKDGDR